MKNIQVLSRTFEILEILASNFSPMQPGELARRTGIKSPTVARIIDTLCNLGYARSCGRRQGYVLGDGAKLLGMGGSQSGALLNSAKIPMLNLAEKLGEYVALSELSGGDRKLIHQLLPRGTIQISPSPERTNALSDTSGRLLLSMLHSSKRKRLCNPEALKLLWPDAMVPQGNIDSQLDLIYKRQYNTLVTKDIVVIAVPVMNHGVLECAAPRYRADAKKRQEILSGLKLCAAEINNHLDIH